MPNNTPWTAEKSWAAVIAAVLTLLMSMMMGYSSRPDAWYWSLRKPRGQPPGWVFGVVWTILYPLIAVAMVAACYGTDQPWTWILPIANIVISMMFSPVMFSLHSLAGGAFITVLCLLMGIGLIIQYSLANQSALAAGLMVPYVIWLILASYLAISTYACNPQLACSQPRKKCASSSGRRISSNC